MHPMQSHLFHSRVHGDGLPQTARPSTPNLSLPQAVLTIKEAAAALRCHPSTIYRLLKAHKLTGFRVGSDWRFTPQHLTDYCEANTQNATR